MPRFGWRAAQGYAVPEAVILASELATQSEPLTTSGIEGSVRHSKVDFLGDLAGIIDLDTEAVKVYLDLGMPE
jgi:hypothetical protein